MKFTPLPSVSGTGRTPDRSRGGADAAARGDSGVAPGMTLSELSVCSGNAVTDSGVQAVEGGTSDGAELTPSSVKLSDSSRSEDVSFVSLSATLMFPVVFVSSIHNAVSKYVKIIRQHNAAMLGYSHRL